MELLDQIRALAELDGWQRDTDIQSGEPRWRLDDGWVDENCMVEQSDYSSRDSIIAVIEKTFVTYEQIAAFTQALCSMLKINIYLLMFQIVKATPDQLREATLRGAGKWKE